MSSVSTYKLSEDLCIEEFVLIALHSSSEDHTLVYSLNEFLKIRLSRSKEDLEIEDLGSFPIFEWKDQINERSWILITNVDAREENLKRQDLFQDEVSTTVKHLIPEHREVDYFLKVEQGDECLEYDIVKSLLKAPNIVTAYIVNTDRLKSKLNLIF